MTETLPTGTLTFLFTDIEGATRALEELGAEHYAVALSEHRSHAALDAPTAEAFGTAVAVASLTATPEAQRSWQTASTLLPSS